jgi:hypothetical protein
LVSAITLVSGALLATQPAAFAADPPLPPGTYGTQEHVGIIEAGIDIPAILDPNAPTSLLYAYGISFFTGSDGNTWADFVVDSGSVLPGQRAHLKAPVLKDLKLHVKNGARAHRPMVDFSYCLGNRMLHSQVELIPRTGYTPSLLLGADSLKDIGQVQPGRQFTVEPSCPKPGAGAAAPAGR